MSKTKPIHSERTPMAPNEVAAFERRVARAYDSGVSTPDMKRRFSLSETSILAIVRKFPNVKIRVTGKAKA